MRREDTSFNQEHHYQRRELLHSAPSSAALIVLLAFGSGVCPAMAQNAGALSPLRFTLKQAVATSLQKSREISLARLQYETTRQQTGVARSQFRPNLYTGSGVAYTSGFPLLAGGGAPALFNLTYNQELFNLPARGNLRAEEQRAEQQRLTIDAVRDGVIQRTVSAYLELAKVRRQLELMRSERASAQKILDYTR